MDFRTPDAPCTNVGAPFEGSEEVPLEVYFSRDKRSNNRASARASAEGLGGALQSSPRWGESAGTALSTTASNCCIALRQPAQSLRCFASVSCSPAVNSPEVDNAQSSRNSSCGSIAILSGALVGSLFSITSP